MHGRQSWWCRTVAVIGGSVVILATLIPAAGQQIHRDGFAGRRTLWLRGENNVNGTEEIHELSEKFAHSLPTSEHIRVKAAAGNAADNLLTYIYPTPPAPITDDLTVSLWVKATKPGIQLRTRIVLPNERNPKQINEPLTVIVNADLYNLTYRWQRLEIKSPTGMLKEQLQLLRGSLRRDVDVSGAYIDRLILNLYTGAGEVDVFIDDLEIGPVRGQAPRLPNADQPPSPLQANGQLTKDPNCPTAPGTTPIQRNDRGILVELRRDRLQVGGMPFFFRAIRHSDTPLKTLRDAGFNTVWFPVDAAAERIEEAANHGFWIVPTLPLIGGKEPYPPGTVPRTDLAKAGTVDALTAAVQKFRTGDAVLFWDLGGARTTEQVELVADTAGAVRRADPGRPRAADIWDGYGQYAMNIELVGSHRWPLQTSLGLEQYRTWLNQRRLLTTPGTFTWTWIQTHLPEAQARLMYDRQVTPGIDEPIGPHPEQIRILTWIALAAGCKGLGFWSDRYLSDAYQGRDRLLQLALVNQELRMLEPILLSMSEAPTLIDTSNPQVKAAVIRSDKGILVLPMWLGPGTQFVPPQAAVRQLGMLIPNVPNGTQPWLIMPGQVKSLQASATRQLSGVSLVLPEFDTVAAIVFTSDLNINGLVARWQEHSQGVTRLAAQWAIDLAAIQYQKVYQTHLQLCGVAPIVAGADRLMADSHRRIQDALRFFRDGDDSAAYLEALRAMRPLRELMRAHWDQAVAVLDTPTASPYTASFWTLPRHYQFAEEVRRATVAGNALPSGSFEVEPAKNVQGRLAEQKRDSAGSEIAQLPGWKVREFSIDPVLTQATIIPGEPLQPKQPEPRDFSKELYRPTSVSRLPEPTLMVPQPALGRGVLNLSIKEKEETAPNGKPLPPPAVLENTYLGVTSPPIRLQPGTIVRISAWIASSSVRGTADGALFYDSIGGEALGVRILGGSGWKRYYLYRRVPPSGVVDVTIALTGYGSLSVDDVRVEPMVQAASGNAAVSRQSAASPAVSPYGTIRRP